VSDKRATSVHTAEGGLAVRSLAFSLQENLMGGPRRVGGKGGRNKGVVVMKKTGKTIKQINLKKDMR